MYLLTRYNNYISQIYFREKLFELCDESITHSFTYLQLSQFVRRRGHESVRAADRVV